MMTLMVQTEQSGGNNIASVSVSEKKTFELNDY